ncbi:MAG: hypothetical protein ACYDCL_08570 [Myxococcales bacterium]
MRACGWLAGAVVLWAGCECSSSLSLTDGGVAIGANGGVTVPAVDGGPADAGSDGGPVASVIHAATLAAPLPSSGWSYYGTGEGLSATPSDVSADEGGNVYVAGGDAVYVKSRGAGRFARFDQSAGLTTNCDQGQTLMCPILSVAGGGAGQAFIGFQGIGTDQDLDPLWQQESGGVDAIAFDGQRVRKVRHVLIATPPGWVTEGAYTMQNGRRKGRQIFRVVFDHRQGPHYGDVWMGGTHIGFSVLFGNPSAEGWTEYPNQYPDAVGTWEHDHPAVSTEAGDIETGDYYGIAIDPTTGDPWAGNEYRTAGKRGYGAGPGAANPNWPWVAMWPAYDAADQMQSYWDVWPDQLAADGFDDIDNPAWKDNTEALTFCADGTLWVGSSTLGIARRSPAGAVDYYELPAGLNDDVYALACDPTDSSIWVGFGWGGLGRLHADGSWSLPSGGPAFSQQPVRSIQIDAWASPRIVYFAHTEDGNTGAPGGVSEYQGP